jgi:transaldolase
MKKEIKGNLKKNGQSLKWFWKNNLKDKLSYNYFIIQINGHATMQDNVEDAITKFLNDRKAEETP